MKINNRILLLVGHYGTGKTTLALNFALGLAKMGENIALADLDVNNPYFRSRDWMDILRKNNIDLIIPDEEIAFAENPFLPARIYSVVNDLNKKVIIDLGGHDVGTKVLGSIAEQVKKTPYDMWMVINTFRPEMETSEEIVRMFKRLQELSQLQFTGLINNTNLADLTEIEDIVRGEEIVIEAAKELNLPFIGNVIEEKLVELASAKLRRGIIPIQRFDLLKWGGKK